MTADEVDARIIDTAAGLFAVQGFERTSVQQVADAVGYSKTGLLHRFPSKQALLTAVEQTVTTTVDELGEVIRTLPGPADGDPRANASRIISVIVDAAMANVGGVHYITTLMAAKHCGEDLPEPSWIVGFFEAVISTLGGDPTDPAQRLSTGLALQMICNGVLAAKLPDNHMPPAALARVLTAAASAVLQAADPEQPSAAPSR